ncbi:hypothetical protein GV792_21335 [Nocardia cyriacigeorgica]|uniref:DUF8020 domain-containing protein n=1 Tax=Nocardia cyriacigeorgica TaxID=135487 RepID=A0A6P1DAP4_9NOCA|nr:hypothetical protein [Nocardia cyriacigeorgica]NEW42452.1 hypothetical protein [Nocardia cyriacigeorgica]NEW47805.1 hypothetical protein [Nocardia cyriacigeorgica]NEW52581.1 hypothetical protein [Nocardia cyriacigeorgica]
MKMNKLAVIAALVTVATGMAAGTAGAATEKEPGAVNFTAESSDTQSIITTDAGSLAVEGDTFKVKGPDGTVLAGTPLNFRVDEFEFPIAAEISGRTATLTPKFDLAHAVYQPVALPFENKAPFKSEYDREKDAWTRLTTTVALGASVGTLVGGLGGAAAGCVLGGIAGATVASATIVGLFGPFIPAAAIGCLGGVLAVGALGTVAGQLLVTAPVAIGAAIQYFSTINQPFPAPAK